MTPDFDIDSCCAILDAGAELSARHVLAQAADPDPSRASDHLAQLCDAARTRELTVDLEFVTWTETRDLDTAALIVQAAGRENAGILIDTLHFARSNCSVAHLARLPREWFRYVQVCDAPAEPPRSVEELIHAARSDRLFLGEGGLDLIGILGALPRATPYALEIPRTALARVIGLEECVRLALSSARKFVQALPVSTGLVPRLPSEAHAARSH
jgi:sugar phosphate isomerase/epimerase